MSFPVITPRIAPLRGSPIWNYPVPAGLSQVFPCLRIARYSQIASATPSGGDWAQKHSGDSTSRGRKSSNQKRLEVSPSRLLVSYIRHRNKPPTWEAWKLAQEAARIRDNIKDRRLPILLLQWMMRRDEAEKPTSLSECLASDEEWRVRLNSLAFMGINASDLDHWHWILEAEDADGRIERFTTDDVHNPIFMLNILLSKDESILKGESLLAIMNYISHHYCQAPIPTGSRLPFGAVRRTLDGKQNMTPEAFVILLRRLVHHVMRIWPAAIVAVAQLASDYIKSIPTDPESLSSTGYARRGIVFNSAMQLFERRALSHPLRHRQDNWKAQKLLLTMSLGLEKPLVITDPSYRAIRMVLLGLSKTDAEQGVARRLMNSWPPYKEAWDGLDERRQPQDDLSRSVKADILKREAGYSQSVYDRSLGALGGGGLDESPSIQTRSLPLRRWKHLPHLNIYTEWAARVKATRNAHEAWQIFNQSPEIGIKPNLQVYAEMFSKMLAKEVYMPRDLPGDGRETFPVHDANFTDVEKARLAPPTVGALYERMLSDGHRPRGHCLAVLISHASDAAAGLDYLCDSLLDKEAVEALTSSPRPEADLLSKMPLPIFTAYIRLLCRTQPRYLERERPYQHTPAFLTLFDRLKRAALLLGCRFPHDILSDITYKAPWYCVMETLAFREKAVHPDFGLRENATYLLVMFLRVFERQKRVMSADPTVFYYFNRVLKGVLKWRTDDPLHLKEYLRYSWKDIQNGQDDLKGPLSAKSKESNLNGLIYFTHKQLKTIFQNITAPTRSQSVSTGKLEVPDLFHPLTGYQIHSYLRTLAMIGDKDEMVGVMDWILQAWELDSALRREKSLENRTAYMHITRVFTFFRAYGDIHIDPATMSRIEAQLRELIDEKGCTWYWPSDEEVQQYIDYDSQEFVPSLYLQQHTEQVENSSATQEEEATPVRGDDTNELEHGTLQHGPEEGGWDQSEQELLDGRR